MTVYTQVAANRRKTWLFLFIYGLLLCAVGYFASWYFQSISIVGIVAIFVIIQGFVSLNYSDKIALAVSDAHPLSEKQYPQVYKILENLCITAGLPRPPLYIIQDSAMNAFATGKDAQHAAIAVTSGLLDKMEDNELEAVLAHELSHIGNEDIRLMSMVMIMAGLVTLISDIFIRSMWWGGGRRSNDDNQGSGVMMLIAVILMVLAPLAATLIQLAISRKREFMADANAILFTRYPEGLISALRKLGMDSEPLEVANRATAHMYISNPLRGDTLSQLFSTHPPIEQRIIALQKGSGIHTM